MLTDDEIQQALHAGRVVPLGVSNPHGPLGLEQLAAAVARITQPPRAVLDSERQCRPITLSAATWGKLEEVAQRTAQAGTRAVSAAEVATAIIEQFVANIATTVGGGRS